MKELKDIYRKRRHQLLPLTLGFAAIFVAFRIIIPQWSDISQASQLLTKKESTIRAKESNIQLLNSIPQETIDADFTTATTALPMQKDVVLIFEELNSTANKSGVDLGGFSAKVGGVYEAEGASVKGKPKDRVVSGFPFLNILVSVSGDSEGVRRFAEELYKSIPLVEIKSIDIGLNDARYDVNFFYKPITVRPSGTDTVALQPLSAVEQQQLETMRSWQTQEEIP